MVFSNVQVTVLNHIILTLPYQIIFMYDIYIYIDIDMSIYILFGVRVFFQCIQYIHITLKVLWLSFAPIVTVDGDLVVNRPMMAHG